MRVTSSAGIHINYPCNAISQKYKIWEVDALFQFFEWLVLRLQFIIIVNANGTNHAELQQRLSSSIFQSIQYLTFKDYTRFELKSVRISVMFINLLKTDQKLVAYLAIQTHKKRLVSCRQVACMRCRGVGIRLQELHWSGCHTETGRAYSALCRLSTALMKALEPCVKSYLMH